jgi:hypothetical protein
MGRDEDGTVWYFGFVPRVTHTQNASRQPKHKQPVVRRSQTFTVLETIQKLIPYASMVQAFQPPIAPKQKSKAETVILALKALPAIQGCDLKRCYQAAACFWLYLAM